MKIHSVSAAAIFTVVIALNAGCTTPAERRVTNQSHPGPAVGTAVGAAVGAVAGNVAGVVVGAGEGAASAAKAPFTNERRTIRTWRQETTSDGRTIMVAVETEVDAQGRPISEPVVK